MMLIDFSVLHCLQSDGGPPNAGVWLQTGAPLCHQVPQSCHGRRVGQGGSDLKCISILSQLLDNSNLYTVFRSRRENNIDLVCSVLELCASHPNPAKPTSHTVPSLYSGWEWSEWAEGTDAFSQCYSGKWQVQQSSNPSKSVLETGCNLALVIQ